MVSIATVFLRIFRICSEQSFHITPVDKSFCTSPYLEPHQTTKMEILRKELATASSILDVCCVLNVPLSQQNTRTPNIS